MNFCLSEPKFTFVGSVVEERFTLGRFWTEAVYALGVEIKKIAVFTICMLLLFGINFIPGIGSMIYAVLAPALTLFFLVVEYLAFVLMRKRMNFRQQRRYIFRHPVMMLGFACAVFCLLAIPFVQFFLHPPWPWLGQRCYGVIFRRKSEFCSGSIKVL